ncbi:hypothetical protein NLJ89_g12161 [Agrocybe chaxingu]|uniref:Hydrophobin n=1 Tax=Agrocybe chaxingu TaxID=84603 RepID=A0A9W8MPB8_9AGAR|nr:hypothetical protein NLJ89_g12161 [Agrocybe chaxingu]
MFSKVALFITAALAASAFATDTTSAIQCCNALAAPKSATATGILATAGIAVQDITALVGAGCTPITVIGVGSGAACATQPVQCEKIYSHSLVGVNCTPVGVQI